MKTCSTAGRRSTHAGGGGDHRPSHLRQAGLRTRRLVSQPRQQSDPRRTPRPLLSRRMRAPCRRAGAWRRRATLAAHLRRRGGGPPASALRRHLRERLSRRSRAAPRSILPRTKFPHHHQPDRHARLPQPMRFLLSGHRRSAHAVSHAASAAGRRRISGRRPALRSLCRQQPGLAPRLSARAMPRAAAAEQNLERRRHHRRHRRSVAHPRHGARRMHRRLRRLRIANR